MGEPTIVVREHHGIPFEQFLMQFERFAEPQAHLEIGTWTGRSFAAMHCLTLAVDPNFRISEDVIGDKEKAFFFQMTSDRFFADYDPTVFLGRRIDSALLDGMHLFEFLLRDIANTEKYVSARATVFLHDCFPVTCEMAARRQDNPRRDLLRKDWWTGDVWKVLPILKAVRPDLAIHCFDCYPTGLVALRNLNPDSTEIADHYHELVREYRDIELSDANYEHYLGDFELINSNLISDFEQFSRYF